MQSEAKESVDSIHQVIFFEELFVRIQIFQMKHRNEIPIKHCGILIQIEERLNTASKKMIKTQGVLESMSNYISCHGTSIGSGKTYAASKKNADWRDLRFFNPSPHPATYLENVSFSITSLNSALRLEIFLIHSLIETSSNDNKYLLKTLHFFRHIKMIWRD